MRSSFIQMTAVASALLAASCGKVVVDEGNQNPDPTVMAVSPTEGPLDGGTKATISGAEFTDASVVLVGPFVADDIKVTDAGTVTFTTPAGLVANVPQDIVVFGQNGFTKLADAFTYNPVPTVDAIEPTHANLSGGTVVTISGTGFKTNNGHLDVSIGGVATTDVSVTDDNTVMATVGKVPPSMVMQPLDVIVTSDNGEAVYEQAFRYTKPGLLTAAKNRQNNGHQALYYLDPLTGEMSELAPMNVTVRRMVTSPDGHLYVHTNYHGGLQSYLVEVDPFSGAMTPIGTLNDSFTGLAYDGGVLYAINRYHRLFTMDPTTGVLTAINAQGTFQRSGCMERNDDNSLYTVHALNGTVDTVAIADGTVTAGPALGGTSGSEYCHGMAFAGGNYFILVQAQSGGAMRLESLVPATGKRQPIANLPSDIAGLAPTPPGF